MGRIYTGSFDGVSVSAAQDLFELVAPSDAIVVIHSLEVSQSSDAGDAEEEILRISLKSGQTTSGSGGTTPTAIPLNFGDAAFGGSLEANNTTKASTGTIVTHYAWGWNVRVDFTKIWTPETRPILSPSRRCTIELVAAPADAITASGTITFEEIGG